MVPVAMVTKETMFPWLRDKIFGSRKICSFKIFRINVQTICESFVKNGATVIELSFCNRKIAIPRKSPLMYEDGLKCKIFYFFSTPIYILVSKTA